MQYSMFLANGKPVRATVQLPSYLLDCYFELVPAQAAAGPGLLAQELTHVARGGISVRAWHLSSATNASRPPKQAEFLAPGAPAHFLPEVDDEVLISFQTATPRATAVLFNPQELTFHKQLLRDVRREAGMLRQGSYRLRVQRRTGLEALGVSLVVADDPALQRGVDTFRIL